MKTHVRVPLTNIQTPQFITIRLFVPPVKERIASTVPFFNELRFVGVAKGITVFSRTQRREVTRIFGFNGNEMQPLWVVPHSVDTSIRLSRIIFHETDLLQELGFIRGNLLTQENPFVIVEDQYKLGKGVKGLSFEEIFIKGSGLEEEFTVVHARSIFYHDCWLLNNNVEYNIMKDDLILIPEFEVSVGSIVTSEEKSYRIFGETVERIEKGVTGFLGQVGNAIKGLVSKKS
jgi:hypothetical protein